MFHVQYTQTKLHVSCSIHSNKIACFMFNTLKQNCMFHVQYTQTKLHVSCSIHSNRNQLRDHTLMTSGKIRKFLTPPPSPLVGLRRWRHTPPPLWDVGIVGTPPPPPPPSCFSPQSPPPPSCPLSPPHQRSYTKIRKFSTQLNQVLTSK